MSEYDDQYLELEDQLLSLCNTLPVRHNNHPTLTHIGKLSLSLDALQGQADQYMRMRFPWCVSATRTNRHSKTRGAFRPSGLASPAIEYDMWMVSSKERERYNNYYRCPCDKDDNEHWHKLVCVVTYDDWGNGPECNLCGEIKENHNEQ